MKDIYRILGVSEDDVDVNIRYCIIYVLHKGILDLSEAWVHQPVIERVLHTGNHYRIGALQPGGGHEGARHLGKINLTRHQGFDRRACVNDFRADAILG